MKLLLRCALLAVGLVASCVAATILCVAKGCGVATIPTLRVASALLWPGLALMGFFYHRLATVLVGTLFAYMASLIPGILIDVFIYAAVFFVLARLGQAVARRKIVDDRMTRPEITTSNTIP